MEGERERLEAEIAPRVLEILAALESGAPPRLLVALDHHRADRSDVRVDVRLKEAVIALAEEKRERVEHSACSEPSVLRSSPVNGGGEGGGEGAPHDAVDAVGGNDE